MSRSNMSVWDFRSMFAFVANSLQSTLLRGSMTHFLIYKPSCLCHQIVLTGCSDHVQKTMTARMATLSATKAGVSVHRDTTTPSAARPVWPVSCLHTPLWRLLVFHPVVLSLTYTSVTPVSVPALLHPVVLSHTLLLHLLVFPPCYTL